MMRGPKRGTLHKGSRTEKLRDFINGGNEPTMIEMTEFIFTHNTTKNYYSTAVVLNHLRKYYLAHGKVLTAYRTGAGKSPYRYKLCDQPDEVVTQIKKNERQVMGNYKNLLRKDFILNKDYPKARASLDAARTIVLTLQKSIIDDELLLLNGENNDD